MSELPVPEMVPPEPGPDAAREVLREVWRALLAVPEIGADDNFFELGGHSMLAARLTSRAAAAIDRPVSRELIFAHPTFAAWAGAVLDVAAPGDGEPELPGPLGSLEGPVSLQQEELLAVEDMLGPSPANNLVIAVELAPGLPVPVLQAALNALVRRHGVLRARFGPAGPDRRQRIDDTDQAGDVRLEVHDTTGDDPAVAARRTRRLIGTAALAPFDLTAGPLLRAQLVRRSTGADLLALHLHHLACDGGSALLLLEDLDETAGGTAPDAPDATYVDYARWQRARLPELLAASAGHWRQVVRTLAAAGAGLDTEPAGGPTRLARRRATLDPSVLTAVRARAAVRGDTDFSIVAAAAARALAGALGRDTVGIGFLLENRSRSEFDRVAGSFATSGLIAIRVPPEPEGLDEEVRRSVREQVTQARRWAELPLPAAVAGPAVEAGIDSADELVDAVVTVEHEDRVVGAGRLGMQRILDVDRPVAGLALNGPATLLAVIAADGGVRLAVDHRDTPAAAAAAEALLAGTVRHLRAAATA